MFSTTLALFLALQSTHATVGPLVIRACETKIREEADTSGRKSKSKQEAYMCIIWDCKNPDIVIYIETAPTSVMLFWESKTADHCE